MKWLFILTFGFISFLLSAQETAEIEYSPTIDFNWSMFKGKVNTAHLNQWGNHTGAVTVSSIGYTTEVRNHQAKIKITALFDPNTSWTKYPNLEHPDDALNHEKRHFQICEIYARKFREVVSKTRFNQKTFSKDIENIFKKLTAEYRDAQNLYDQETDHSLDHHQQEIWNEKIDKELKALTDFRESYLNITLN